MAHIFVHINAEGDKELIKIFIELIFPASILLGGVYFSFRLRLFSLFHPLSFVRTLKDKNGSFRSLNLALAGTLGVGNIVGVVNAMRIGGEGAVLWMCISAMLCANLKYAEAYLASVTKRRRADGCFGGAYIYIKKTLKRSGGALSVIFALFFIVNSLATGCCMQASAVVSGVESIAVGISPISVSLLLAAAVLLSVVGGIKKISGITNRLVPVMTCVYLVISFTVIFVNRDRLGDALLSVWRSAFSCEGIICGIGGFCFTECMRCGIMRGLLSNEAGCGSSASAHATEEGSTPHRQGCLGIAEVYADTVIMCSVTALALMVGGADFSLLDDISLTVALYRNVGGALFSFLSVACIAVFGYAAIICFAGYGTECVSYIFGNGKTGSLMNTLYIGVYILTVIFSSFPDSSTVLALSDVSMGVMSLINIPVLIANSGKIFPTLPKRRREDSQDKNKAPQ